MLQLFSLRRLPLLVASGLLAVLASPAASQDWARFRGPNGAGVAGVHNLPLEFSADRSLWQREVPFGQSSPILVGDLVLITAGGEKALLTAAFDAASGEPRWSRSVPRQREDHVHKAAGPSIATPTSDGRSVFSFFPEFGLVSYDLEGNERWRHEMPAFDSYYGMASSPVLEGDVLVLQCDQQRKPFLIGVDKNNGELLWRKERAVGEAWSTPVILHPGSDSATVVTMGTLFVDGYAVRTGERLFSIPGVGYAPVASPALDGTRIFVSTEDGTGEAMPSPATLFSNDADGDGQLSPAELATAGLEGNEIWLDRDGDGGIEPAEYDEVYELYTSENFGVAAIDLAAPAESAVLWRERRAVPYISSPILHEGVLFVVKDGGILTSIDAKTGEVLKRGRIQGATEGFSPSPVISDGRIYLASNEGKIAVLSAVGEWELLALSDLDERIDATPAIGDGRMVVRTRSRLMSFGASPGGE